MPRHPVLVVGGGLAGLRAAIAAQEAGVEAAVLSLVYPMRSHSVTAQGGINASLGNNEEGRDDSPERHAFDTVKGSDYLADQDAVEVLTVEAVERVLEMEHWGTPFSRTPQGRIAQRRFGGGVFPRTCYAADKTGHALMHTLFEQSVKRGVRVYPEWLALALTVEEGTCHGLVALELASGRIEAFPAEAVIFATGGAGRLYLNTTNSLVSSGSPLAIAYRAGAPLKDMEFVQFHPTSLYGSSILITEAARGEGGYLLNSQGKRFLADYAPQAMELAPRDIVARAIQQEVDQGRGFPGGYVHLDIRHLGKAKIMERLPEIFDLALTYVRVNPLEEPIPIVPAQHYTMGGIACNTWGETGVKGLFAAGECACVSVHGANRLGGNSLLETVLFGKRAGERAAQYVKGKANLEKGQSALEATLRKAQEEMDSLVRRQGEERASRLRQKLGQTLTEKAGIFREREEMKEALAQIKELQERSRRVSLSSGGRRFNYELISALELGGMLEVAEVLALGALKREESRGSHFRRDFPQRDDAHWLKHTLACHTPEGPALSYEDVAITRWAPEARKY